ncbi:MAG: hypothetical protein U0Z26_14710 [Anaerolineales bacterium]
MKRTIFLLSLILVACAPAATQSVVLPQLIAQPTAYIDPSYPTAQVAIQAPNQTASGFNVNVDSAWMDGKNVNANVCYTLPDGSDWSIWAASLTYGGNVQDIYGTTLLSIQEPANGQAGLRCDTLTFVVTPDADLTNATITVNSFGAPPREGEYCDVYMPKIQQTLLERGIGISLDCTDVNGVQTMQIVNMPPDMTQEQAEQIVYSDEFFTVKGPWSFSFNLAQ